MKTLYIIIFFWMAGNEILAGTLTGNGQVDSFRAFFVFNQPKYAPGDTAFFEGYIVTGNSRLFMEKIIVNLELIDGNGREALHNRVLFEKGVCNSQLLLLPDLNPGIYTLIAFADGDIPDKAQASLFYESDFVIADEREFIVQPGPGTSYAHPIALTDSANFFFGPKSLRLQVDFDRVAHTTREPVHVTITITDSLSQPVNVNLTVTVLQDDLFRDHQNRTLLDCSICDYKPSLKDEGINGKIHPFFFKGKVVNRSDEPLPDSTLITFYLPEEDFIYGVYLMGKNAFEFPLFKNFQDQELFYKISYHSKDLKEARIILDGPAYNGKPISFGLSQNKDSYGLYAKEKKMIERSYTFYADRKKEDKRIRDTMSEIDIDYTVDLSKFESFPTMADVLGNIVQAVKFRKSKDESGVRVFLKEFGYYAASDPVYIIDGIMTDNTVYFLGLEPSTVSKIGVIRSRSKLSRYGFLGLNGIVVVDTKIANHDLNMPRTERSLRIIKINQAIKFPERVRSNESIPDVRAALYWDPQIAFDGKGKAELSFTTGDATGNFCLKIEGFTADGTPVFYRKNFKVVYEPASK